MFFLCSCCPYERFEHRPVLTTSGLVLNFAMARLAVCKSAHFRIDSQGNPVQDKFHHRSILGICDRPDPLKSPVVVGFLNALQPPK
jgi:hypothetical protein